MAEVGVGVDRRRARGWPGAGRRRASGTTAATRSAWAARSCGSRSISGRRPRSSAAIGRARRGAGRASAPVARASGSSTGRERGGQGAGGGRRRARNAASSPASGRWPTATRCQTSSKRAGAGEVGGVVAAVVEAALVAEHVADGGVGDGDAVEAGGDVDQAWSCLRSSAGARLRSTLIGSTLIDHCYAGAMTRYVGAAEAARRLGVQRATLYAYVSRGLIERRVAVDGRHVAVLGRRPRAPRRPRRREPPSRRGRRSTCRSSPR